MEKMKMESMDVTQYNIDRIAEMFPQVVTEIAISNEELGMRNEEYERLFQNTETNGRFHSDWCSMIYPRLQLARNLLTDDGVIFISIDDNEVENLKKICDEVFGANNFIADLIWQKKFSRANDAQYFSTMHDHILCYCKKHIQNDANGWKIGLLPRGSEIPSGYSNPDNDSRGLWTSVVLSAKSGSDKLLYEITAPSGRVCSPPSGRYWSVSKEKLTSLIEDNRIWFGSKGDGTPRLKTFLSEVQDGLRPNTILFHSEVGHNQEGKQETKALFDGLGLFDGPKPVRLLKHLTQISNCNKDAIILDFFSGSATTAHAVMQLNAEDEGNRKFIMVQLPEETDEKSEARKAGYKNICEIGKERIRRAGAKIVEESKGTDLFTAEENKLDIGFRVFKTDTTNMKDVYYSAGEVSQATLFGMESNIKEDRTDIDLLYGALLDWGVELTYPHTAEQIDGFTVHTVGVIRNEELLIRNEELGVRSSLDGDSPIPHSSLLTPNYEGDSPITHSSLLTPNYDEIFLIACFDENISEKAIREIASRKPLRALFRDHSFKDSANKINVYEIFKAVAPDTSVRVL